MEDPKEIEKKLKEGKKALSKLENKMHEKIAEEIEQSHDLSEGKKGGQYEGLVKKAEFTPNPSKQEEIIEKLKQESEAAYHDQIKDPAFDAIKKRKLASYTMSVDTIQKIKNFSAEKRMNQSRFVEMLVEEYEEKIGLKSEFVMHNSAGPVSLNLLELANQVAQILESKNMIKTQ